MNLIPVDVFRYIFTLLPRAFKYRSVCQEWKLKLSERMFVYLWEQKWVKSGVHLQWVAFDEQIFRKSWFGKINYMGIGHIKIPYNGYHFDHFGCFYYVNGVLKNKFIVNQEWIKADNAYFYINWPKQCLIETKPYFYLEGFHVIKGQTVWLHTDFKNKIIKCSKEQHQIFLSVYNSGVFQHLIQAYVYFKSRAN